VKSYRQVKKKVIRVLTASYVVPWHMHNTLKRISKDFDVYVVGQGVTAYRSVYPNITFVDVNIDRKTRVFKDFSALVALVRIFIAVQPDITHSIMPKAGLLTSIAAFLCRVPVRIHTFTGQTWVAKQGGAKYFYYYIDKLINRLNTKCITDSPSQSEFLLSNGISKQGCALDVLSIGSLSGVDIDKFDVSKYMIEAELLKKKYGLLDADYIFAFIARKTVAKGAVDMLLAFSLIREKFNAAKLLFIGPDEDGEISRLKETQPELFENVIDIGEVESPEHYLALTKVLCLPSYREGFGSIVIDAAAMGVPTIGYRIPGLVDSVEDKETGLLVNMGEKLELVNAMNEFLVNPKLHLELGDKARLRVHKYFSADILYACLKDVYLETDNTRYL